MLSEKINKILNEQIQKEFFSAYLYLGMEAYFTSLNLDGFANFFRVQVQEERDHAMKFFNYINQKGGKVELLQINAPEANFESAEEIFALTLGHEQFVTQSIYNIVNAALDEKDHATNTFLQWFVTEQVEEEATMEKYLRKLQLIKNDPNGLLMLDAELAQRVYTPPAAGTI
ncbi:ferritin [Ruminiclostridium hungatei]|uniref:Ferritin n=1 Tax=Ruminiclostridium hungatei TaxID=48256 RepID=A0A1V4SPK1_RUMHU|nr:ferritin [Ruminiclostridium hungatei]OPX45764.1 ferritin [Ruminiclostridium hungatei]